MSKEVSFGGGLPANVSDMAQALAKSAGAAGSAGSDSYMKMDRTGAFLYGVENTEVEEGSLWAVNPMGFKHGWTCWGNEEHGTEGKNMGEVMVPSTQPMPLEEDLPNAKGDWTKCVAIQLRCISGEDEGTQVAFKTNSNGGRKAYANLLQEIVTRITSGETEVVPAVELLSDSYKHSNYGKIFNPIFDIQKWMGMDGEQAEEPETEAPEPEQEEEAPKPARRRSRKAS